MTDPSASKTDLVVKFSLAMSTSELRWRRFSCSMRLKISGSVSSSDLFSANVAMERCVGADLATRDT